MDKRVIMFYPVGQSKRFGAIGRLVMKSTKKLRNTQPLSAKTRRAELIENSLTTSFVTRCSSLTTPRLKTNSQLSLLYTLLMKLS
ncbi:hypothetical protein J6590_095929 [Homalodisca vitripennis]|nr:hypothetical protein J6590_095929 [Homalodisca vitripennis]